MALNFSGQANNDFDLVAKGEYETILNMEWKKTKAGDTYINCAFKIRKDVEQAYAGRIVFDAIYKSKKTNEFNQSKINGILSTIPNAKLSFENYDEVIQYCNGHPMKVTVEVEAINPEDPNSKMKNTIKFLSYRPTQFALKEEDNNAVNQEEAKAEETPASTDPFASILDSISDEDLDIFSQNN